MFHHYHCCCWANNPRRTFWELSNVNMYKQLTGLSRKYRRTICLELAGSCLMLLKRQVIFHYCQCKFSVIIETLSKLD